MRKLPIVTCVAVFLPDMAQSNEQLPGCCVCSADQEDGIVSVVAGRSGYFHRPTQSVLPMECCAVDGASAFDFQGL